jgi:glycosyltransferase involved in cell wall biosynthesis
MSKDNKYIVTVLMPVYNGEKYLGEAIASILNQDFKNFQLLLINDGSEDASLNIMQSFKDDRIKIINNEQNIGLIKTLNKGLDAIQTKYIARMDADDVCEKNRLSQQVKFMEMHPEIGASGSYYYLKRGPKKAIADFPLTKAEIEAYMLFNCPIAHPTAIIDNELVKKKNIRYSETRIHSEDFQFWIDIASHAELANIPVPLLNYRMHENQITGNEKFTDAKTETLDAIRMSQLLKIGLIPNTETLKLHHIIANGEKANDESEMALASNWLSKILLHAKNNMIISDVSIKKIVLERWLRLCINYYGLRKGIKKCLHSELYVKTKLPFKQKKELLMQIFYAYKRLKIK